MRKRRSYLRAHEYASNMRVCIIVYTDEAYCVLEKASSTPFNMVNRQPLANKYSLDISRDRLIPTYKYTYTYRYTCIHISNDRTLLETLKISGTMLSSNLLYVPTNGLIVTPYEKSGFFFKQRYANFPTFSPTFSTCPLIELHRSDFVYRQLTDNNREHAVRWIIYSPIRRGKKKRTILRYIIRCHPSCSWKRVYNNRRVNVDAHDEMDKQ